LDDIGIENIIPSEGLVFMYNGNPYKFTGTFAPVNQILGTLKFAKGKAEETPPEPEKSSPEPETPPVEKPTQTTGQPEEPLIGAPKTVGIFAGRFQPFHAGHYSIYQAMVKKFGKDNVYIASSNKTDATKSPFDFADKKQIMTRMFDMPEDKIVQVQNPYAPKEILEKLPPNTIYVTAVSQKDSERLSKGKYFKPYEETPETERKSFGDAGYYMIAPEMQLQLQGKNVSGTQIRSIMGNPNITDRAKQEIFTMIYGKFDQDIFKKITTTATESEEALKLTQQHGGEKAAKAKIKPTAKITATSQEPKKPRKQAKSQEPEKGPDNYKPGETWTTDGGNFGGKNSKNLFKYFDTMDKAKKFAKT